MSEHAIITRLHYPPDSPLFPWRLSFYQSMVLPRLQHQTNQDFEIWVICHPNHAKVISALDTRIQICTLPEFPKAIGFTKSDYNHIMPRYMIQTALDSDDLVSLDYIAKIKEEVGKSKDKPLVISFQPCKLVLLTMKRYRMWERYDSRRCSMFHTLYIPPEQPYNHILNFDHSFIAEWYKNVVIVPEGYCDMTIHGTNWMTSLEPNLGEI